MTKLRINNPSGTINVIPSKSELHRLLFIAVLRNKYLKINNVYYSEDVKSTINVLKSCGANITCFNDYVIVQESELKLDSEIFCNESGTTLRFIIPFVALIGGKTTINGQNKLVYRPVDEYFDIFNKCNITYTYDNKLPLTIDGKLIPGEYKISGKRSSQFISALIIALSFLDKPSKLIIKDKLESKSYVDMTINILKLFNVDIEEYENYYIINNYNNDNLTEVSANGDYSQAAFFLVMNALGANISLNNINDNSLQGDINILKFLKYSGVIFNEKYEVIKNDYKAIDINLNDNPDLAPILSIYASKLNGISYLRGLERLQYKESDRFIAICEMLDNLGVKYSTILNHTLIIEGNSNFNDAYIDVKNDHRILFSAAVCSMFSTITVDNLEAKDKSYQTFFDEYIKLGGKIIYD